MRTTLTALALCLPAAAFAQETVGTLSGTIDGVQVAYTIMDGDGIETGWSETDGGTEVQIEAYPADAPMDEADRLRLTFLADAASMEPEKQSADIELNRDGSTLTATDDAVDLTIGSLEATGDSLLFTGNIRTTMSEGEENVGVLAEDGVTLSADVQSTLIRTDDDAD